VLVPPPFDASERKNGAGKSRAGKYFSREKKELIILVENVYRKK